MLAQGNKGSRVRGPIASLNSLVGASPAKPRHCCRNFPSQVSQDSLSVPLSQSLLSLNQLPLRAGRAGNQFQTLKCRSIPTKSTVVPAALWATLDLKLHPSRALQLSVEFSVANNGRVEKPHISPFLHGAVAGAVAGRVAGHLNGVCQSGTYSAPQVTWR